MKKTFHFLFCLLPLALCAQPDPLPDSAFTEGNKIKALIHANGALFHDFEKGQFLTDDLGRSPVRAAGIWIGGRDPGGNLKVATQLYNEDGRQDFVPGMADLSEEENKNWNKIWRVTAEEILYHFGYYNVHQEVKDTLPSIFGWPAKGNKFFKQFNGFDLPDNDAPLAPFFDWNGNGQYEPELGETPFLEVRGCEGAFKFPPHEILWTMFHDNTLHSETPGSIPIRMTVQCAAATFLCTDNEIGNNTVILSYRLINSALEDIDSTYFGMFMDFQLGCPEDDYIATLPEKNIVYVYNSDGFDEDCGDYLGYGEHPPAVAMKLYRGPLDEYRAELPLSSVMPIFDDPAISGMGKPETDVQYYRYLSGTWKDGTPLTYGEDGYNPLSTNYTKFIYPKRPGTDSTYWTEINAGNAPGRRKAIAATGPFILQPNASTELVVGFTFFPNEDKNNIDVLTPVNFFLQNALAFYFDECFGSFDPGCTPAYELPEIPELPPPVPTFTGAFQMAPNLVSQEVKFVFKEAPEDFFVEIFDSVGRKVFGQKPNGKEFSVDVSDWHRGIYVVVVRRGKENFTERFIVMRP